MELATQSEPSPVIGEVGCQMTRSELKDVLEQSQFGFNASMFEAYFVKGSSPPICVACGRLIQVHPNGVPPKEKPKTANPNMTVLEAQDKVLQQNRMKSANLPIPYPMPLHWRDSAFRLFSYYNFKEMDIVFHAYGIPTVKPMWTCVAGGTDHPCNYNTTKVEDNVSELKKHLQDTHHVDIDGPFDTNSGQLTHQWSSGLFDCAQHPRSCVDCLLCYPCGLSCWCPGQDTLGQQSCMVRRLNNITNHTSPGFTPLLFCQHYQRKAEFVVYGHDPSRILCNWRDALSYPFCGLFFLLGVWPLTLPFVSTTQPLFSIFSLCGFPCRDIPPALHNDCYQHRRYLVEQQGIPETHLRSKLISVFCWPCSECQVWRELQYNGIWPGLCLFRGSDADQAAMVPQSVARRLAHHRAGPVGPSPMGCPATARVYINSSKTQDAEMVVFGDPDHRGSKKESATRLEEPSVPLVMGTDFGQDV